MGIFARLMGRMDRQSTLMGGMMERLGVDLTTCGGDVSGHGFERAVRACAFCGHDEQCQSWQDAHAAGAERAPDFCPNAGYWEMRR